MPDLTPPPHEPMDDDTRARIAARLTDATGSPATGVRATRWLAPVGAAAAVLLIASVAGWAAFSPGSESDPAAPSVMTSEPPSPAETEVSRSPSEPPTSQNPVPSGPCARYVQRELGSAEPVATFEMPAGEAAIWVSGEKSLLCENSGGIDTAHPVRPVAPPAELGTEQLGFSSSIYDYNRERMLVSLVAGGRLPDDVTDLRYIFPGQDVQAAAITTDDEGRRWWILGYVPEEGPVADPRQNRLDLDPVTVQVVRGEEVDEVTLEWGQDDCTHVNHGC